MKFIHKGPEPETLKEFKALSNPPDWVASYDSLPKTRKDIIKKALIEEQKGLCCYCECRVTVLDSHIEHFKPQHTFAEYALDYNNMLCSCMVEQTKGTPLHCGMAKKDWFEETKLISPLDLNCEAHFKYLGNGTILPKDNDDVAAKETIKHLRLDDKELTAKRKEVIDVFLDASLTEEERNRFLLAYIDEHQRMLPPFVSAVKSVLLNM